MRAELLNKVVNTVLYEGYMLYPYRHSSIKNKHRWNFGIVYPTGMEPCWMTTECLIEAAADATMRVEVRFLQLYEQDGQQDAIERSVTADIEGIRSFGFEHLKGEIQISREGIQPGLQKVRVTIVNQTRRDESQNPLLQCLVSVHTILSLSGGGQFVSLLDPPQEYCEAASACRNVGTWPVFVGIPPERDCVLSSPIILYDYPRVAEESPGDLFDATEIDEILTLRILTLSDEEKGEIRRAGGRESRLLERAESLTPEQLLKLHGTMRDVRSGLKPGDRVRIRPRPGGDIFDVILKGHVAVVESIEQDFENRTYIAVIVEDDPGKDLGVMRQPGHRFFFSEDELELIA
jgi:hypothetical protein